MSEVSKAAASIELEQLFTSLREAGRDDPAYCVAHAGSLLLGEHTPEPVARFAREHQPARPRRAERPLSEEAWYRLLAHPADDPFIAKVFECVLAAVRTVRCVPLTSAGLRPQDAVHPSRSSVAVVRALGAAAFALEAPVPLIFVAPTSPGAIEGLPTDPIASVAGAKVASGRSLEELSFLAGHHMARYRASQYVRVLYDDSLPEMTALFAAALRAARPSLAVDAPVAAVADRLRAIIERDPAAFARLERVVQLFVDRAAPVDLGDWIAGAERTCLRAALLLGGDLHVASRCLAEMPGVPEDALADLTTFAMSEAYFSLRQQTGIALWPDRETPSVAPPEPVREVPSIFPPPAQLDEEIARAEAELRTEAGASVAGEPAGAARDDLRAPGVPRDATPLADGDVSEAASFEERVTRGMQSLLPALRAAYARAPEDFDVRAPLARCPFTDAIAELRQRVGASAPWGVSVEGLGVLWTAPPCDPPLAMVDPALDARLSPTARAWLAAECVALLAPSRIVARMAPTTAMLVDAVVAVSRAVHEPASSEDGSTLHPVVRALLADESVLRSARAWLAGTSADQVRQQVQDWCRGVECDAIAESLTQVSDAASALEEVAAARPFRPGMLEPSAWRAAVERRLSGR
jgi:hypothetical protein